MCQDIVNSLIFDDWHGINFGHNSPGLSEHLMKQPNETVYFMPTNYVAFDIIKNQIPNTYVM